jgi:hypothetical protein
MCANVQGPQNPDQSPKTDTSSHRCLKQDSPELQKEQTQAVTTEQLSVDLSGG